MSKHTPTPWVRFGVRHKIGPESCIAVGPDNNPIAFLPIGSQQGDRFHAEAFNDAAHIVLCVNAHDGLVAALECVMHLYGAGFADDVKATARAALAQASGQ